MPEQPDDDHHEVESRNSPVGPTHRGRCDRQSQFDTVSLQDRGGMIGLCERTKGSATAPAGSSFDHIHRIFLEIEVLVDEHGEIVVLVLSGGFENHDDDFALMLQVPGKLPE